MNRSLYRKVFTRKFWFYLFIVLFLILTMVFQYHRFFKAHSSLQPAEGGIYIESTIGSIKNLNPLSRHSSELDRDIQRLVFSGLLKYNPQTGKFEDDLAVFRIGETPRTYVVTLKEKAKFSSGRAVTMDDILFTFEKVIQNPSFKNENLRRSFEYVSLQVVDDRTIKFVLPEQNVYFPNLLTTPILPAKPFAGLLIEEVVDPANNYNQKPYGTGPYRLTRVVPHPDGTYRLFFVANKYAIKKPKLERVVLYAYPNFETFQAQQADQNKPHLITRIPAKFQEDLETTLGEDYQSSSYILPRFLGVFMNLDRPLASKPALRNALYLSADKEKILETEKYWDRVDSSFFYENVNTSFQMKDFIEARKELRDNGFIYDRVIEQRRLGRNGDPVKLNMITAVNPPEYSRMAQRLIRVWEDELSIEIELEVLAWSEFRERLKARDYDLVLYGKDFTENFDLLSMWHSSQSGKLNLSNLTREDVDFLIGEVRFSGSQSDFFTLSQKIDDLRPAIILSTPQYRLMKHKSLMGVESDFGKLRHFSNRFTLLPYWYLETKPDWNIDAKNRWFKFLKWSLGFGINKQNETTETESTVAPSTGTAK